MGCVNEERIPTASVMAVPIRTYQGHAIAANGPSADASEGNAAMICFANTMNAIVAIADRHADDRVALDGAPPEDAE